MREKKSKSRHNNQEEITQAYLIIAIQETVIWYFPEKWERSLLMNKFTRSKRPKEERIKQQTRESEPYACRIQDICLIIEFL